MFYRCTRYWDNGVASYIDTISWHLQGYIMPLRRTQSTFIAFISDLSASNMLFLFVVIRPITQQGSIIVRPLKFCIRVMKEGCSLVMLIVSWKDCGSFGRSCWIWISYVCHINLLVTDRNLCEYAFLHSYRVAYMRSLNLKQDKQKNHVHRSPV